MLTFVMTSGFAQTKEERNVSSFTGVAVSLSADVQLTQGSPQRVVIEASENDLENIVTVVRGGILEIKREPLWRGNLKNVTIWITMPEVDALNLSGSASILAERALTADELEIKVSGSGKIDLRELKGNELSIIISGSGNVNLAGMADEMDIALSGSGGVRAQSLTVSECSVRISGSGNCDVDATDELEARISGSGRITYYSNPEVDASVSGSGRITKGNN